nr:MAG TPA_asm: hypothetical protein [Caudoviricetes sp.]
MPLTTNKPFVILCSSSTLTKAITATNVWTKVK